MAERNFVFENLATPENLLKLKEYLREIYQLLDNRFIAITRAATVTFDADEGEVFYVSLDGNITSIVITNPYQGRTITIIFKQDATGNRTVAGWAATVMLAGNAFTATATASRYSTLTFTFDGTNWVETNRTLDVY